MSSAVQHARDGCLLALAMFAADRPHAFCTMRCRRLGPGSQWLQEEVQLLETALRSDALRSPEFC
jgi:hypothetical protein